MLKQRDQILEYLRGAGKKGAVGPEIADSLKIPLTNITPRLSELRKQGFITVESGDLTKGIRTRYFATVKEGFAKPVTDVRPTLSKKKVPEGQERIQRRRKGDLQALREQIAALNALLKADYGVQIILRLEEVERKPQLRAVVEL